MRRLRIHQSVLSKRSGFTIVELMMVVGIVLFLIATSAIVVRNIGNKSREKATMATIVKINGLLNQRTQAFQKYLESTKSNKAIEAKILENYIEFNDSMNPPFLGSKSRAISKPVMEILAKKDLFRESFPQFLGENLEVDDLIDGVRNGTVKVPIQNLNADLSAEYLYYIITQHEGFGVSPAGEDTFNASEVADTDNDGLKEFVDGWGRPLRFYRWPTRVIVPTGLTDLNGDGIHGDGIDRAIASVFFDALPRQPRVGNELDPLLVDPDDPLGRIVKEDERLGGLLVPLFDPSTNHAAYKYSTVNTFWMPLIVSAGEDGILGLYEPNDLVNNGALGRPISPTVEGIYDNITNHNQRAGGR